jgi:glycosyltransferase involved in cell wall biosynthesis
MLMESSDPPGKITQPPLRVAVIGTANWLDVAAELLWRAEIPCDVLDFPSRLALILAALGGRFRKYDVIHCVGGRARAPGLIFRALGKPVVWHWIGTDVMHYGRIHAGGGGLRGWVDRRIARRWARVHLADSPELAAELADYGLQTEVVRLLPKAIEADIQPLPEQPAVLSYWRSGGRDFYHAPLYMQLAEAFPDVPFYVTGDDGEGMIAPANVHFLGSLPCLDAIYDKISVYIRIVRHDSLSAIVLEALARGRYVIYSKPLPHTETANDFSTCRETLGELLVKNEPNKAGAAYVREHFSLAKEAGRLCAIYRKTRLS